MGDVLDPIIVAALLALAFYISGGVDFIRHSMGVKSRKEQLQFAINDVLTQAMKIQTSLHNASGDASIYIKALQDATVRLVSYSNTKALANVVMLSERYQHDCEVAANPLYATSKNVQISVVEDTYKELYHAALVALGGQSAKELQIEMQKQQKNQK